MSTVSDRDLLLGVLAREMGVTDRQRLVTVMNTWAGRREKPLGDALVEAGELDAQQRAWLECLVDRQIARHGDARNTIAALGAAEAAKDLIDAGASRDLAGGLATLVSGEPGLKPGDRLGSPTRLAGRYEIVRPHARGGLGEVFLARDGELHREVALKEIQSRCADNADLRGRFMLEAEITGCLEHPNIVPVYGLGSDREGRPFYVMRFIRGESLLDAIDRYHGGPAAGKTPGERTLGLRRLLGCFVAVCNAAAYAHSRGVIHRDLKPSNVMLGPYGETLLVDWGLAKLVGRSPEAMRSARAEAETPPQSTLHPAAAGSPTPTHVGAVVGTLAYMSPEQAAGLVDQLGPASDIYGLGAILYAILTGGAPFGSSTIDQMRQQIILGKFVPPRQANRRVSRALEAICLKAMALDPGRRYATARELADDVEAWLADEPVGAWREPWHLRAGRWMRRHRALVGAGMAAVLVAAASLTLGVILLTAANERERAAKALAERQEQQARENFQLARDAVDKYLTRVSEDPRLKAHDLERLRRDLLETARDFYQRFIRQRSEEPDLRAASAWAHFRLAVITADIDSRERAVTLLRKEVDAFSELASEYPEASDYPAGKLQAQLELARLCSAISRPQEAAALLASARPLAQDLLGRDPKSPTLRAALASVHGYAAWQCIELKQYRQAEDEYRAAIAILEKLVAEYPDAAAHQSRLARNETGLGLLCRQQGRRDEAVRLLVSAANRHTRLVDAHRDVPEYLQDLATACDNLAMLYGDASGAVPQIETAYEKALVVRNQLWRSHPDVAQYQADVARSHFNLAVLYFNSGQLKKAEASYASARQVFEPLTSDHPDMPEYRNDLGAVMNNLGILYRLLGRPDEGLATLHTAIDVRRKLASQFPENRHYLHQLGSSWVNLGDSLALKHRQREAEDAYQEAVTICEKLVARFPQEFEPAIDLGSMYAKVGSFVAERSPQRTDELCRKAIALVESRPAAERELPAARTVLRDAYGGRAVALGRLGRHDEALAAWDGAFARDADASHLVLRLGRAEGYARAGQHARAAAEAKDLAPGYSKHGAGLYRLAVVWALASAAAAKDEAIEAAQRPPLAERYAKAAVAALGQCRDTGFFQDPFQAKRLADDADLAPLRARRDFIDFAAPAGKP